MPVSIDNDTYLIDTGFIVFNKKTYPYFCKLLEKLNVPIQRSEMSFSYRSDEKNLEYNGHNLNTLFADRRNLRLTEKFKKQIHLNTKIKRLEREANRVVLKSAKDQYIFDSVVIATHSDQALQLLANPTNEEHHILSAIAYTENDVILHTDTTILPKHQRAWASWNYLDNGNSLPTLTYYMNRLQSINSRHHFCVSVNLMEQINQNSIIKRLKYAHPCLNLEAIKVQQQQKIINGKNNTYYVGSYWGHGFHEDGIKSAVDTCKLLGVA
jgi:predicted NAD/FAD-binding protein